MADIQNEDLGPGHGLAIQVIKRVRAQGVTGNKPPDQNARQVAEPETSRKDSSLNAACLERRTRERTVEKWQAGAVRRNRGTRVFPTTRHWS